VGKRDLSLTLRRRYGHSLGVVPRFECQRDRLSAMLPRLACPLRSAECRVRLSLPGRWSCTTRPDTILAGA